MPSGVKGRTGEADEAKCLVDSNLKPRVTFPPDLRAHSVSMKICWFEYPARSLTGVVELFRKYQNSLIPFQSHPPPPYLGDVACVCQCLKRPRVFIVPLIFSIWRWVWYFVVLVRWSINWLLPRHYLDYPTSSVTYHYLSIFTNSTIFSSSFLSVRNDSQ